MTKRISRLSKTEQKLIENLDSIICEEFDIPHRFVIGNNYLERRLIDAITEAGYVQEEAELVGNLLRKGWIPPGEAKGYVQLAEDQTLPADCRASSEDIQQDMIREGWRKVIIT